MSGRDPMKDKFPRDPEPATSKGTARVQSHLGNRSPGLGAREHREDEGLVDQASERAREAWHDAREQVGDTLEDAREQASEWSSRAAAMAARARDEVSDAFGRTEERLEEQTGAVTMIREHPLLALGLAFGTGFLLAADSGHSRRGLLGKATGQLRSALLGGLTSVAVRELQDLLDEHGGPAGLMQAITGRSQD